MDPNVPEETKKPGFVKAYFNELFAIPCAKTSYFYGICSGVCTYLVTFMTTSRPKISSHVGMTTLCVVTLGYFVVCRSKVEYDIQRVEEWKRYLQKDDKVTLDAPNSESPKAKPGLIKV